MREQDRSNDGWATEDNPEGLREIERDIAAAVVISSDGAILMGRKDPSKGGVYPDAWHIPGGGVEPTDENLQATMLRELGEEAPGLDLDGADIRQLEEVGHGATEKIVDGERVWCKMKFNHFEVRLPKTAAELQSSLNPGTDLVELRFIPRTELPTVQQIPGGKEFFVREGYL